MSRKPVIDIGTKLQVYKGLAKQTSGGLKKSDIVKVNVNGVIRYKSKKQQQFGKKSVKSVMSPSQKARELWGKALQKALTELRKKDSYYKDNILVFKPGKEYEGYKKNVINKGIKLYNLTRKYYTDLTIKTMK